MEKHPISFLIGTTLIAAFAGQYGSRALDVMSKAITDAGWCDADNGVCLLAYQVLVLLLIPIIAYTVETKLAQQRDWTKVIASIWQPIDSEILGGIRLHNGSNVDLKDCEVEFSGFYDDAVTALGVDSISEFMNARGDLPRRLYWFHHKRDPEPVTTIGRGKDGLIPLLLATTKEQVEVVGRKPTYKIAAEGVSHYEPVIFGWVYIRISAQVNNTPLPLLRIKVRIEVENNEPTIKEVLKVS